MTTSMIHEDRFFRTGVKRLFTGKPWEMCNELLQNAQRSLAAHVWISFPAPYTCVVKDDGHGLVEGVEGLRKLLVFSDSGFADPQVEANQRPLGMGFYSLIANERITRVKIESYSAPSRKVLVFALDVVRWLDDGEYRASWRERVSWREREAGETGFQLTITGTEPLMAEIRTCLLDTPARREREQKYEADGHWIRSAMSPACGYGDLLEVTVDGEVLDTSLPSTITIKDPHIIASYQGNAIRMSLFPSSRTFLEAAGSSLGVNWYGQLVFDTSRLGWYAYLHVRTGHPVNPRAPTRAGLIDDESLRALYRWIEDRLFEWVCSLEQPAVEFVERLYAINRERAERECPFAIIQPWKPLPADYVFESYQVYDGLYSEEGGEGSDQLGAKQVIRKSDVETVLILDESVTCPLRASHPAQTWYVQQQIEKGDVCAEDTVLAGFGIGLTSLLRAIGLTAYKACTGVPEERVHTLWWRPGPMVDDLHTTTPGEWGIQDFSTPEDELECISRILWHPLSADALPVFVVDEPDGYDVTRCRWIIALAEASAMVSFMEHCGHAAFVPDEDDYDESVEAYGHSVKALIRSYLHDTMAKDIALVDLPEAVNSFLPAGYDARYATFKLILDKKTKSPIGLRVSFSLHGYRKNLWFYS